MTIATDAETHQRTLADNARRPATVLPDGDGRWIWLRDEVPLTMHYRLKKMLESGRGPVGSLAYLHRLGELAKNASLPS